MINPIELIRKSFQSQLNKPVEICVCGDTLKVH